MFRVILVPKSQYLESFNTDFDFEKLESLATIDEVKLNDILKIRNCYYSISCIFRAARVVTVAQIYPNFDNNKIVVDDSVVCPFCGVHYCDHSEFLDSENNFKCTRCGTVFKYEREVVITYKTKIIEQPDIILLENKV